jgi:hypothetical protein
VIRLQSSRKEIEFIAVEKSEELNRRKLNAGPSADQRLVSADALQQFIRDRLIREGLTPPDISKMPVNNLIIEHYLSGGGRGDWKIIVTDAMTPYQLEPLKPKGHFLGIDRFVNPKM